MAYTPINWQTGDTITAAKLNRCDNGWGFESTEILSETVTTVDDDGYNVATLAYSNFIDSDSIVVTFDDTDYVCANLEASSGASFTAYGAPWSNGYDFSEYPFNLYSDGQSNSLVTEAAGTHTIAVDGSTIVTSSDFDTAAQLAVAPTIAAIPTPYLVTVGTTTLQEVFNAIGAGKIPIIVDNDNLANSPRYIEVVLYARKYNLTVSSATISNGSVVVKNYTADSASGPIYEAS